jgi:hypothetical protein
MEMTGYPASIDNPDDWAAFMSRYLDNRVISPAYNGIGLVALHIVDAIKAPRPLDRATAEVIADALLDRFYVGKPTGQHTVKDAHKSDLVAAILAAAKQ